MNQKKLLALAVRIQKESAELASEITAKLTDIVLCRQISSFGEGLKTNDVFFNGDEVDNIYFEDDEIALNVAFTDRPYFFSEMCPGQIIDIGVGVFSSFSNEKECVESNAHKLVVSRSSYSTFSEPMKTSGVTDDELQNIADMVDNNLFNNYKFHEEDLLLYINDNGTLLKKNPQLYEEIDMAYYKELEEVGLDNGVVYESDIDEMWGNIH